MSSTTTTFSDVHPDIVEAQILGRLDGPTLAFASCVSSQLHSSSQQDHIWTTICHSTWPSTATPLLRHLISTFPGGPRSFFSLSFPFLLPTTTAAASSPPPVLISAVDIHYKNKLVLIEVHETETLTGWFRCSPFRIDLLDTKDVIPTTVCHSDSDEASAELAEEISLSWVLIDPVGRRAANLSSQKAVSVERHWLTGEVQVRFASILAGGNRRGPTSELVQCGIVVTCGGGSEEGAGMMQLREVSLLVEDMDGMQLTGKDSLVILHNALEGKRKIKKREEEERRRYKEYLERKRERRERKLRNEGTLDTMF
ncbi:probable F-box protein At2g36090 [Camellia sinensis]|uniref:probable F-box protein At2g36090 n=1 Tax=Camellia sinensis TaxID=4442 RepID=UPI0010363F79|nr:probable F-box protein At2g36090 [Camellia sinensis]